MSGPTLDDLIDYYARMTPGQFGPSTMSGLLNPPNVSPNGTPVPSGAPAPAMPPAINIPVGPPPAPPSADPAPIASGTTAPAPTDPMAALGAGKGQGSLDALAQQLMAMANKPATGLPFPKQAQLQPGNTGPMRPLPLNLPKFGGTTY